MNTTGGILAGPVVEVTGTLPAGVNNAQFTLTATAGTSADSIVINLKRCDAITLESASDDYVVKLPFNGVENVVGVKKAPGETITLTISVDPDTTASYQKISWQGATVIPGTNRLQATVVVDTAVRQKVVVSYDGHPCKEIWVWPIWVDLTVRIAGDLSPDNGAELIEPLNANVAGGPKPFGWPDDHIIPMGGGTKLGPIDHYSKPSYKHAITGGKVEIMGVIKPALVWQIEGITWFMDRKVVLQKFWDNGKNCPNVKEDPDTNELFCMGAWANGPKVLENIVDTSERKLLDLDPSENGKLFDLDIPGCPPQFKFFIQHTAENYVNFDQWAAVHFGTMVRICSGIKPWSYQARIDGDNKQVIKNELNLEHIPEADMVSHFDPR